MTLTTSLRGSEKEVFFDPLRLSSSEGTAEFSGSVLFDTFFPSGMLALTDVDTGSGEKVNASLSIDRFKDRLEVNSSHLAIGEIGLDSFRLSLAPLPAGASFALSTSFAGFAPGGSPAGERRPAVRPVVEAGRDAGRRPGACPRPR